LTIVFDSGVLEIPLTLIKRWNWIVVFSIASACYLMFAYVVEWVITFHDIVDCVGKLLVLFIWGQALYEAAIEAAV